MSAHRCDPDLSDTGGIGPVTESRVLALVLAGLKGDGAAGAAVIAEMAGCQQCLATTLCAVAGGAADLFKTHVPDAVMALELELAAARAAAENPDGG
ncbi:hypothetical protein [Mycobacterium sp. E802]|uniref:hypothetical protein n=1 Tax=Mycobacterium sp. E802 TaxID=1834152 RepID=UPI0018D3B146|nr:hypothetical protein [Mycobacterium sp. E802]